MNFRLTTNLIRDIYCDSDLSMSQHIGLVIFLWICLESSHCKPPLPFTSKPNVTRILNCLGDAIDGPLPARAFRHMPLPVRLVLSYNGITAVHHETFHCLHHLVSLGLNYNELSTLPSGVFLSLVSLQSLSLKCKFCFMYFLSQPQMVHTVLKCMLNSLIHCRLVKE